MTNKSGYALRSKSDSQIVVFWTSIPGRIDLPNGVVVFGATETWPNASYEIVPHTWTEPDPIILTVAELIDLAFPQTGVAKALFEALFEIANRLQTLEGKPLITRQQLKDWLVVRAS